MCKLMFGVGMSDRVCVFREMYGEGKEEKAKKRKKNTLCGVHLTHLNISVHLYHYLNGLRWQKGRGIGNRGHLGSTDLGSAHQTTSRGVVSTHVA